MVGVHQFHVDPTIMGNGGASIMALVLVKGDVRASQPTSTVALLFVEHKIGSQWHPPHKLL
jgi:hypothetical protein